MRRISLQAALLGLAAGAASAQVHGGYTLTTVNFANSIFTNGNGSRPLVGDMEILADGSVAVAEWGNPSSLFILSGFPSTSNIQVKRFAKGLDNVMGIASMGNHIYVMEKEALTQLVDTDNDGVADEYNSVNQAFPSDNSMLNLPYDISFLDGSFYAGLSSDVHTGGYDWGASTWPGTQALAGRSTMYKLNLDGTSSAFACGFRNPNGMDIVDDDIFVSENQGSWTPSSKVIHVRQGKFYGHRTNPANACQTANNNAETPPVVWSNWGDNTETGRSWGNPFVLRQGRFKNHMLVPDLVISHANPVVRVFMEEIDGELQGVILPFIKSGTLTGVHRVKQAANGDIYLGNLGSNCCWGARSGMAPGFQVMRDNDAQVFEIKAIRSKGNNSFELEFTEPVNAVGNYAVTKWRQVAEENYGGGNNVGNTALTVQSATLSTDRLKVTLQIANLTAGWVVKFVPSGVTSQSGRALFTNFAVYTLNRFGPGRDYVIPTVPTVAAPKRAQAGWKLASGNGFHVLRFGGDVSVPRDIAVYDLRGNRHLEMRGETGPESRLNTAGLTKGMYMVRVTEGRATTSGALVIP